MLHMGSGRSITLTFYLLPPAWCYRTGFEAPEALMLLVPEAYRNHPDLMKTYPEV